MRIEIAKLHKQLAATMVYVTHDQVEAMTLADRIVVLNAGLVEQVGAPLELYHHPASLFVAGFIGSPKMNFLQAKLQTPGVHSSSAVLGSGVRLNATVDAARAEAGSVVTVGIRAEHIELLDASTPDGDNILSGEVMAQERLGDLTYLYLQMPDCDEPLTVRAQPTVNAAAGSKVRLRFPPEWIYMFDAYGKAFARHAASVEMGSSH